MFIIVLVGVAFIFLVLGSQSRVQQQFGIVEREVGPNIDPTVETREKRTIQQMVSRAAPGATLTVPAGIYRETVTVDKPVTLIAEPGAEIRGSDVWASSQWIEQYGRWISTRQVPEFSDSGTLECELPDDRQCTWPEQVFIDGQPLVQVTTNPRPGQFAVTRNRNIVIAENPAGRTVEVTVREAWVTAVSGGGDADNVTLDGFTMKHAAARYQRGAIRNMEGDHWAVKNSNLSHSHGAAIWMIHTTNIEIAGNEIHNNGQQAVSLFTVDGGVIRDNRIYENNIAGFDSLNEGGGVKGTVSNRLVFENNHVSFNNGPGIWADLHSDGWIIRNNRIHHNERAGITYEVSFNGRIHDNFVWENGHGAENPPTSAGINVQGSQGTEVHDNVVAWNGDGVIVWDRERLDDWSVAVSGNRVCGNDIFIVAHNPYDEYGLAWIAYGHPESALYDGDANNRAEDNRYFHANPSSDRPRPFRWLDDEFSWYDIDQFNDTEAERNGAILGNVEKLLVLSGSRVPTHPERQSR